MTLGVGSTGRGAPPWGASHEDLMEDGGMGISKGLAPSQAEGLLAGSLALLTSARQHASFREQKENMLCRYTTGNLYAQKQHTHFAARKFQVSLQAKPP